MSSDGQDETGRVAPGVSVLLDVAGQFKRAFPDADASWLSNLVYLADVWSVKQKGHRLTSAEFVKFDVGAWSSHVARIHDRLLEETPTTFAPPCTAVAEIVRFVEGRIKDDILGRIETSLPFAWGREGEPIDFVGYETLWAGVRDSQRDLENGDFVTLGANQDISRLFAHLVGSLAVAYEKKKRPSLRRRRRQQRLDCQRVEFGMT